MIRYSVVIPERDGAPEVARQLPRLSAVFQRLTLPYEVLIVDDGSSHDTHRSLQELQAKQASLRLIRLDAPIGASQALSAGIEAARGEIIIALEPGERYPVEQIPQLIGRLSRLDMVCVRQRLKGWRKLRHRLARIPRALLLGLEVRQPERLFWAARREAVAGIHLKPGMQRYLPWMVARRGFRVGDIYVDQIAEGRAPADRRASPFDLLIAWQTCRHWRNEVAQEIHSGEPAAPGGAGRLRLPAPHGAVDHSSSPPTAKVA